jgi:hypothetical protein
MARPLVLPAEEEVRIVLVVRAESGGLGGGVLAAAVAVKDHAGWGVARGDRHGEGVGDQAGAVPPALAIHQRRGPLRQFSL